MKKADTITAIILLVFSGYVIQESWRMPPSATFGPSAGFLPLWLGVLLAILATILLLTSWTRPASEKDGKPIFPGRQAVLAITLVMVGLAAYILLIEVLGFVVDTFLFIVFLMKAVEHEKWPLSLMIAAGTTVVLFVTFQILLQITLPSNMFGF
jgi:putative tricarboxylic transport membrane protein